ncbi:flavin-containing monooxygenase FMO GS-OX-like 3 [Malania oleifera]|uniref:flavin-containing monooxygenase FMO GS-OX-like 3 n=1 Tax=Malania oleifera TaxID=397392 RepID=UPI0025ADCBF5|nr:flavin-containing monooxygenase FMO GS-OX-like 3 [Malania oleifera]
MAAQAADIPLRPPFSRSVAVIGAGAGGLIAAHELRREGHKVVVFERAGQVGGTWVYDPLTESDPLGLDPSREIVQSSLYASLRTNLPRESMGFRDYPFVVVDSKERDPRRFPGHREVLFFLRDFARDFGLCELVRFETQVFYVGLAEDGRWTVKSRGSRGGDDDEIFDAVVVCNGHHTEPRIAEIPGIDKWPGKQIHSHNYRTPELFQDKVVIIVGSSASAIDISSDIAGVAKEVHIAKRSDDVFGMHSCRGNVWSHSMIESTCEDGTVIFQDGSMVLADVILHCTGYKYHFPFLETNGIINMDDNRVGPLYKHVFPPALAPWLSFVGLPWRVIPFPMFELQSKWIAGILSSRIALPSQEEMMRDVESFYSRLEASGTPKRYTHNLLGYQFEYNDWLAAECCCAIAEEWRKQMFYAVNKNRCERPVTYRDEWEDQDWILKAHEDFAKFSSGGYCNGCIP